MLRHTLILGFGILIMSGPTYGQIKAGVARETITPKDALWMAGYAGRTKPAEGKAHELWAKAVALEDAEGRGLILLTTDLIGLPRSLSDRVANSVMAKTGLKRESLMLTSSHTHCGPVLRDNLWDMYNLPPEQVNKLTDYTTLLATTLADVMVKAWDTRTPAVLSTGEGVAGFAQNRRKEGKTGVTIGVNPSGPVDHTVPILRVVNAKGPRTLAVVFGYACHNTTLDYYQWSGDYAGYAQEEIEKAMPGTTALFWMGCGADANPFPSRTEEMARRHGKSLADAVIHTLNAGTTPVAGPFRAAFSKVNPAFDNPPTKADLEKDLLNKQHAVKTRAARFLKQLHDTGTLDTSYPHYPIQVWTLGPKLNWVALGGEVVVDYAHRLRREHPTGHVWVTGYANDVMAYIPSARVLKEGGYEADMSMVYYGMPGRWKPEIEDLIITETKKLLGGLHAK
jgi:hypothetical protein